MLEHLARKLNVRMILRGQRLQRLLIGARLAADVRFLDRLEAELREQHLAQSADRGDVELAPRKLIDLLFRVRQARFHLLAHRLQERHVEANAGEFHLREHFDERDFEVVVEVHF